jgi:hypothetical protein
VRGTKKNPVRKFLRVLAFGCAVLVTALLLLVLMHRKSRTLVAEWEQPSSIDYHSFGPYYLSVQRDDLNWASFPISRNYSIYVGRESGTPNYGHWVKYSFHPGNGDEVAHIKGSSVAWKEDGVTLQELSGHRLFIPKAMFVGGR